MWPFIEPISLIRYLIVWKVNRTLVRLPRYLPVELSRVLGTLIAERLPTREAQPWRKAMTKWEGYGDEPRQTAPVPEAAWPIESVLFVYPGKQVYGQGETILWELKLVGQSADHGLFLEVILPAMEEASRTTDSRWHRPAQRSVWGSFDVQAIYAARGPRWEPVASDGKLDLRYRALPSQWADGLTFTSSSERTLDRLTWITPFDLPTQNSQGLDAPTLPEMLEALAARMGLFIPGKRRSPTDVWKVLSEQDQAALRGAIEQAARFPLRRQEIKHAPKGWPGKRIGAQTFLFIPDPLVPYLELASILHIGKQTHFGCGTFILE
jgi:hypothetical protein